MSLTNAIHESLPYIDTEPKPSERAAAQLLIDQELSPDAQTTAHPSLPPYHPPTFTPLLESFLASDLARIQSHTPNRAISTSRYETLSLPSATDADALPSYRAALSAAYTARTYLSGRATNLALLEQFGKNAWLVGNSQLEDILRDLERELAGKKEEIDRVVVERRAAQEAVGAELSGLEEGWKRGVGRVLETEVAAEGMRRRVLEARRAGGR